MIDEIVREAKKLDKLELQIPLSKFRVKKMQKEGVKPAANYDKSKIKAPTMKQIDKWKHDSRAYYSDKNGLPISFAKNPNVAALSGVWKGKNITLETLRKKAWGNRL